MKVTLSQKSDIDFAPGSVYAEILQNVRTILATRKGTVPLDREFGTSWDYLDAPLHISNARAAADIVAAVQKYEPRCEIENVMFENSDTDTLEGRTFPVLTVSINDDAQEDEQ